jgi:hypothetical protein
VSLIIKSSICPVVVSAPELGKLRVKSLVKVKMSPLFRIRPCERVVQSVALSYVPMLLVALILRFPLDFQLSAILGTLFNFVISLFLFIRGPLDVFTPLLGALIFIISQIVFFERPLEDVHLLIFFRNRLIGARGVLGD